jgi:hypothetical protein
MTDTNTQSPKRLYKKSMLTMIENAIGTKLFATFYAELPDGQVIDTLDAGNVSCAAFVSGILSILGKLRDGFHGTVERTVEDLRASGWVEVMDQKDIQPADVIVWASHIDENGQANAHIGFAVSATEAISNSSSMGVVCKHDMHFGEEQRQITHIFRLPDWEQHRIA